MKKYFWTMTAAALVLVTACKKDDKDIPPALTTIAASDITASSATLGGNITEAGTPEYTERGVCYDTTTEPTIDDSKKAVAGSGTGEFSVSVSELSAATTYYVRAYAIHTTGTVYGDVVSFTTLTGLLEITTSAVTVFTDRTAVLGGNITNAGTPPYSARGVCYATTSQPTVDDNRTPIEGSGTGAFSVTVSGLTATTTYYVRAYALHASGTIYGNEVSFTTEDAEPEEPEIATNDADNISSTTATLGGNIIYEGFPVYTERGVCYATTDAPTVDDNKKQTDGTGTGSFSVVADNLTHNTVYYARAYAINATGTFYGEVVSFKTLHSAEHEMVLVEAGSFIMGDDLFPAQGKHQVTLTKDFKIAKYTVTQKQWFDVMGTTLEEQRDLGNPAATIVGEGDNYPMYYVSWEKAQEFIAELNALTGKNYRMPTEAEWVFAALGGNYSNGTLFAGSDNIDAVGWYAAGEDLPGNANGSTHPIGQKEPNELGLYDMSGNVWEFCSDYYSPTYYDESPEVDPQGPTLEESYQYGTDDYVAPWRAAHGGSWTYAASVHYINRRNPIRQNNGSDNRYGIRLVLSVEE